MIIVEGADHVGKTTFCEKLLERMRGDFPEATIRHCGKPDANATFPEYWDAQLPDEPEPVIFDRLHIGAFVYGSVLELHPAEGVNIVSLAAYRQQLLNRWYAPFIIIVTCDKVMLEKRLNEAPKPEEFDKEQILRANDAFTKVRAHDWGIHCYGDKPFPTDKQADHAYKSWRKRWMMTLSRRSATIS